MKFLETVAGKRNCRLVVHPPFRFLILTVRHKTSAFHSASNSRKASRPHASACSKVTFLGRDSQISRKRRCNSTTSCPSAVAARQRLCIVASLNIASRCPAFKKAGNPMISGSPSITRPQITQVLPKNTSAMGLTMLPKKATQINRTVRNEIREYRQQSAFAISSRPIDPLP